MKFNSSLTNPSYRLNFDTFGKLTSRKLIISLLVNIGSYQAFVDELVNMAKTNRSFYVCVANAHMTVEALKDESFARDVNNADLVTPDGMPLALGMKWLYGIKQDRVAGMNLLPDLLQAACLRGISVYFYGGTDEMLDHVKNFCLSTYQGLKIVGSYSPPFRELSEREEAAVVENINESGAGFVFVALGCPKQEKWMASMKNRINACMVGVGGALPVTAGIKKRAPNWMQKASLEWLFRLCQEPRRLFMRYLVTNNIFIYHFAKALFIKHILKR